MVLSDELERIAALAATFAEPGEEVAGILTAEPGSGLRVYLCAYTGGDGRTWLALDEEGRPIENRTIIRDAASIAALCEVAADTAGGGDLEELRAQLVALRVRENPPGIDEAEEAALELERALGAPPRVASPAYLDHVGAAVRRLELALGGEIASPFAEAMKQAMAPVDELMDEIEQTYKRAALTHG
jgi:hypothetical protein